jgi:hypothetical protein
MVAGEVEKLSMRMMPVLVRSLEILHSCMLNLYT